MRSLFALIEERALSLSFPSGANGEWSRGPHVASLPAFPRCYTFFEKCTSRELYDKCQMNTRIGGRDLAPGDEVPQALWLHAVLGGAGVSGPIFAEHNALPPFCRLGPRRDLTARQAGDRRTTPGSQ